MKNHSHQPASTNFEPLRKGLPKLGFILAVIGTSGLVGCSGSNFLANARGSKSVATPGVTSPNSPFTSHRALSPVADATASHQNPVAPDYAATDNSANDKASNRETVTTPPVHETQLVTTVSAMEPHQASLITLGRGESLAASMSQTNGPALLDFYATWCGPCRSQGQILHDLESVAAANDARIIKIDIDQHPDLAKQFNVSSLPTLVVLENGRVSHRRQGLTPASELASLIRR